MSEDPRTESAMEASVLADGDRLTELRARLAVLDEIRERAKQGPYSTNSRNTLWAVWRLREEALLDIGIAERQARGGRSEP